jgi:3-hydroxyacyl-[acyl-carrier-protein] dehydratase
MRFHLLDRIETLSYGKFLTAVKCVALADDVFTDHFPGYPIFPGSLILESLAQAGGALFELTNEREGGSDHRCLLTSVKNLSFRRAVVPGDRLHLRAEIMKRHRSAGAVRVRAEVDGVLAAEGELTFAFQPIASPALDRARAELYALWLRHAKIQE